MGLTHMTGTNLRNQYAIEKKLITNGVQIVEDWYIVYERKIDTTKNDKQGRVVGLKELCRSRQTNEANKIKDMYIAVCPEALRIEQSDIQKMHERRVKDLSTMTISNMEMMQIIQILFKDLGVNADQFHDAVKRAVTPKLIAKAVDNTSLNAPMKPPGPTENIKAVRVIDGVFVEQNIQPIA